MKHLILYALTSAVTLACCGSTDDIVEHIVPLVPPALVVPSNSLNGDYPNLSEYGEVILSDDGSQTEESRSEEANINP